MNLMTVENLRKSYGTRVIFDGISFGIEEGEKIGLIGVNGTGKSTLLKTIAGISQGDTGVITKQNGTKIAYLSQDPVFGEGVSVLQQVFQSDSPKMALVRDYEEAVTELTKEPTNPIWSKRVMVLTERMDKEEGWGLESEAKTILTKLGITDFQKDVSLLSGGQRKRVAMASALISPVELLILDEPTNHIDNDTVEWLEKYLVKYGKALLMVTHDRYFLNRVVDHILELEKGQIYRYEGNYSTFLEKKAEREALANSSEQKRQNLLRRELEWVRRGAKARTTKQKARLQRFDEVSSQKGLEQKEMVEMKGCSTRLGRKTIVLHHLQKSYDGVTYIKDFDYTILRNDRIGIVGENGCGKSTLLKMMIGQLQPDSGEVEIGETVKIGVFAQENLDMEESQKVIDYIRDVAEYIQTPDGKVSATQMLEKFLFEKDMHRSPISVLSGGERRRLYLLKVLMDAPNILFLDEPTNDLDIETLGILEEYLETFAGAVVTVSHDRYFLDKVVGRIFSFLGDGQIRQFEGGYTDFRERAETEGLFEEETEKKIDQSKQEESKKENKRLKMSYNDQREYDTIGDTLAQLEKKVVKLETEIQNNMTDYVRLQELTAEKEQWEAKLEVTMERWMELSELVEEIQKNKE